MNVTGSIIGGLIGGVVGAALWGGISYFTGYEIGWIAWGVGGLVGLGCALASSEVGPAHGIVAVVITVLSILGGKFLAVELSKSQVVESYLNQFQDDEYMISLIADEVVEENVSAGKKIQWPPGVSPSEAIGKLDYPPAIWREAKSRWDQMGNQNKEAFRNQLTDRARDEIESNYSEVSKDVFLSSFSLMDLLFFGLAVVTAYRIASQGREAIGTGGDEA
jgi:hypothetical protein